MEFTYTYSAETWNSETHSYDGGTGSWSVVDGSGTVTVENLGDHIIYAKLAYVSNVSGVTGTFDIGHTAVESNRSVTSKLTLAGNPVSRNVTLGRVNISLSRTPLENSWNVGDEVIWYGADGEAYTCIVANKNSSKYVLITKNSVQSCNQDNSEAQINDAINSTGADFPLLLVILKKRV